MRIRDRSGTGAAHPLTCWTRFRHPQVSATARIVLVHGEDDLIVPKSQSIEAEQFGAEVVLIPSADHFDMIDPSHVAWAAVLDVLTSLQSSPGSG